MRKLLSRIGHDELSEIMLEAAANHEGPEKLIWLGSACRYNAGMMRAHKRFWRIGVIMSALMFCLAGVELAYPFLGDSFFGKENERSLTIAFWFCAAAIILVIALHQLRCSYLRWKDGNFAIHQYTAHGGKFEGEEPK